MVGVDLPFADAGCGLPEYAAAAIDVIGLRADLTVVVQSISAFIAPIIATAIPVDLDRAGRPDGAGPRGDTGRVVDNTALPEAARRYAIEDGRDPDQPFDPVETFLHDVAPVLAEESARHVVEPSSTPFGQPWPLARWPDVATRWSSVDGIASFRSSSNGASFVNVSASPPRRSTAGTSPRSAGPTN